MKHSQVYKVLSHFLWNVSHQTWNLFYLAGYINCLNTPTLFTQAFLGNVRVALRHEKFICFYGAKLFITLFTNFVVTLKLRAVRIIKFSSPNIPVNTLRKGLLNCLNARSRGLTFRHRASCNYGQAFRYSPENAFYIFNQQIYFII